MMKQVIRAVVLLIGGSSLAACAAQQCDPNRADLFSGIGCSVGHGYSNRTATLRGQYQATSAQAQQAQANAQQAEAEASSVQTSVQQRRIQLAQLDVRTRGLRQKLAVLRNSSTASEAQKAAAEQGMNDLNAARAQAGNDPSSQKVQELQARQQHVADILSQM